LKVEEATGSSRDGKESGVRSPQFPRPATRFRPPEPAAGAEPRRRGHRAGERGPPPISYAWARPALLEWYFGLHWSARLTAALLLLGVSTFLSFAIMPLVWILGWLIGRILLMAAIPEKKSKWGDW
jgi:hypothetical protein